MTVKVHAFDGLTGGHIGILQATSCTWSDSINDYGDLSCHVLHNRGREWERILREYGAIIAAIRHDGPSKTILHAGYLTRWKPSGDGYDLEAGGGWTILDKRLVLNHNLDASWRDGQITIDEDNPPGDWILTLRGTYRDIVRGLINETLKWGSLPISLPAIQGGTSHERTYQCWDLSTVSERIGDIADLEDGPEIRFDPILAGDGIRFQLNVGDPEIIDTTHRWNLNLPGQHIMLTDFDADGDDITNEAYAIGGKTDDRVLVARRKGDSLRSQGWPLLQTYDGSHTSVSETATLQSYTAAAIDIGDHSQCTIGIECLQTENVHVGDHAIIRLSDTDPLSKRIASALGLEPRSQIEVKITDTSGDITSMVTSLQARPIT